MMRTVLELAQEIPGPGTEITITYRSKNGDRDTQQVHGTVADIRLSTSGRREIAIDRDDGVRNVIQGGKLLAPRSHVPHFGYVTEVQVHPPRTEVEAA